MTTGLLLFAHGARDPQWSRPFEAVAARLRASRPETPVRLAYLEFMAPGLQQAGAELVAEGCSVVHVLPMFLGAGGHVRQDLPRLVAELQQGQPGLQVRLHPALGEMPALLDAMAAAAASLLEAP